MADASDSPAWTLRTCRRGLGLRGLLLALCASSGVRSGASLAADASAAGRGYALTDPGDYDEALRVQAVLDDKRSARDCFCGESVHRSLWLGFHEQLHAGLAGDPGLSGEWVHSLCGMAYPVIFRVIAVEPADDSFTMHTDCPAGLLSMLVVCAQSAALHQAAAAAAPPPPPPAAAPGVHRGGAGAAGAAGGEEEADEPVPRASGLWRRTPRVVLSEGASVGDVFGPVPLEECLAQCERTPGCLSLAFGPNGCHLKARCVQPGEPMVPKGVQGDDYQTFYRAECPGAAGTGGGQAAAEPARSSGAAEQNTPLEEMQSMIRFALRALEFCFHCLDSSPWPFLLAEILENYALAVEGPGEFVWQRAAGRLTGPSTNLGSAEAGSVPPPSAPSMAPQEEGRGAAAAPPALQRVLLRLRVRWVRGFEMEAEFWRRKLSQDPAENVSLERLRRWLATGEVTWFLEDDDPCAFLQRALRLRDAAARAPAAPRPPWMHGLPRILNAGSGPFAPRPLECSLDSASLPSSSAELQGRGSERGAVSGEGASRGWHVPVVAADGMARFYLRVFDEHGLAPPHRPVQCPVEELDACFPARHFDVVHMRNALDHSFDPLLGLRRMLHVLRPGGWLLLRHARNEGVPGKFRNGLHQWAFDAEDIGGASTFVIWNPELRVDVTAHLLGTGLAAEVHTELREHPNGPDAPPEERYVWVDIRKPTEAEVAARLVAP